MKIPISNFESEKNSWVYSEGHDRKLPKPLPCIFHIWLCNHFLLLSGSRYCHVYPPIPSNFSRSCFRLETWNTLFLSNNVLAPSNDLSCSHDIIYSFSLYIFYLYRLYDLHHRHSISQTSSLRKKNWGDLIPTPMVWLYPKVVPLWDACGYTICG